MLKAIPNNPKALIEKIGFSPVVVYGAGIVGTTIAAWLEENHILYDFADKSAETKDVFVMGKK